MIDDTGNKEGGSLDSTGFRNCIHIYLLFVISRDCHIPVLDRSRTAGIVAVATTTLPLALWLFSCDSEKNPLQEPNDSMIMVCSYNYNHFNEAPACFWVTGLA